MADRNTNPYFLQWFEGGWPFYRGDIYGNLTKSEVPSRYENVIYGLQINLAKLGYNFHRTPKWTLYKSNIYVSMQPVCGSFTISSQNHQCGDFILNYGMAHEPQHYVLFEEENVVIRIEPSTNHETWFWLTEYEGYKNPQFWTNIENGIDKIHCLYPQYKDNIIFGPTAIKSHWKKRRKEIETLLERKWERDMWSYNSRMYIGGYM